MKTKHVLIGLGGIVAVFATIFGVSYYKKKKSKQETNSSSDINKNKINSSDEIKSNNVNKDGKLLQILADNLASQIAKIYKDSEESGGLNYQQNKTKNDLVEQLSKLGFKYNNGKAIIK